MDDDSRTPQRTSAKVKTPKKTSKTKKTSSNTQNGKKTFRDEWNLFWQGLTAEETPDEFANLKVQPLSMLQIKELTKNLSQERNRLNQRLESIQREIELNSLKMQSVELVGGDAELTRLRLNELHDQGQKLTEELALIDAQLRSARKQESQEKIASLLG